MVIPATVIPWNKPRCIHRSIGRFSLHPFETIFTAYKLPCGVFRIVRQAAEITVFITSNVGIFFNAASVVGIRFSLNHDFIGIAYTLNLHRDKDPVAKITILLVEKETIFVRTIEFTIIVEINVNLESFEAIKFAKFDINTHFAKFAMSGPIVDHTHVRL